MMEDSSDDFTTVEMSEIERTLSNSRSQSLARRIIKTWSFVSKYFSFRLKFIGTKPEFAQIFWYDISKAQIIQDQEFWSTP